MFATLPRSTDSFDDRSSRDAWEARADRCANRARAEAEARGATAGEANEAACLAASRCHTLACAHERAAVAERVAAERGASPHEIEATGDAAYARHLAMVAEAAAEDAADTAQRESKAADLAAAILEENRQRGGSLELEFASWIPGVREHEVRATRSRAAARIVVRASARVRAAAYAADRNLDAARVRRILFCTVDRTIPRSQPRNRHRSRRARKCAARSGSDGDGGGDPPGELDRRDQIGCSARVAADQREAVERDAISAALADARSHRSDAASLMNFGSSAELSRDPRRSRGAR